MKSIFIAAGLLLVGCGSNSGVVRVGQDNHSDSGVAQVEQDIFKIYKRAATGLVGSESVKSDVLLQASKYCTEKGKQLHVVNVITGSPPYIFGNFPKAEVQFKCLDTKELGLARAAEKGGTDVPKQGNPAQDSMDIYTELKKLKGLLDDGIITQAEFDSKKKQILAK